MDIEIIPATFSDYPTIQNMARFYVYDMSRYCGNAYPGWDCPEDGLYVCDDFKKYFEEQNRRAFLLKAGKSLAGFVLLNKICAIEPVDWNMGEFFILAQFQSKGYGQKIAKEIFRLFPGKWSIGAIPENEKAVRFWRKIVNEETGGKFRESLKTSAELKTSDHPDPFPMVMFLFEVAWHNQHS